MLKKNSELDLAIALEPSAVPLESATPLTLTVTMSLEDWLIITDQLEKNVVQLIETNRLIGLPFSQKVLKVVKSRLAELPRKEMEDDDSESIRDSQKAV